MKKYNVYGIGNLLIDIVVNVDDSDLKNLGLHKGTMHLTDEHEREKILSFIEKKQRCYACGGSAPNTMIALSSLNISAVLAGIVGSDDFGSIYQSSLKEHNIYSEVSTDNGSTGSSIILISPDSERTMNTYLGINRQFSKDHIDEESLKHAEYLYFTGYMWDTELQKEALLSAIDIAKKNGIQIIFDAADPFAVNRNKLEFLDLIKNHFDIVFANAEEAKILFNTEDVKKCASFLSDFCRIAVVKNGCMGSLIKSKEKYLEIPVNKVSAVDTTGAGDMYAAGFIYGLCKGKSLYDSGLCASFLASQIVCQQGAQFSPEKQKEISDIIISGCPDFTLNSR